MFFVLFCSKTFVLSLSFNSHPFQVVMFLLRPLQGGWKAGGVLHDPAAGGDIAGLLQHPAPPAQVKDHISSSYGVSGNFRLSIHLPEDRSSLRALSCTVCTAPTVFLSEEQLGAHLLARHGNFYFKRMQKNVLYWCR